MGLTVVIPLHGRLTEAVEVVSGTLRVLLDQTVFDGRLREPHAALLLRKWYHCQFHRWAERFFQSMFDSDASANISECVPSRPWPCALSAMYS